LRLTPEQGASMRAAGEYQGKQAPETLKILRESAVIESTESSSRIEGVTVPPSSQDRIQSRRAFSSGSAIISVAHRPATLWSPLVCADMPMNRAPKRTARNQ